MFTCELPRHSLRWTKTLEKISTGVSSLGAEAKEGAIQKGVSAEQPPKNANTAGGGIRRSGKCEINCGRRAEVPYLKPAAWNFREIGVCVGGQSSSKEIRKPNVLYRKATLATKF